jgi:hypothetical protein
VKSRSTATTAAAVDVLIPDVSRLSKPVTIGQQLPQNHEVESRWGKPFPECRVICGPCRDSRADAGKEPPVVILLGTSQPLPTAVCEILAERLRSTAARLSASYRQKTLLNLPRSTARIAVVIACLPR